MTAHPSRRRILAQLLAPLVPVLFLLTIGLLGCSGSLWRSQIATCGNAVVDPGESCDDGNLNNHDGCSTGCDILTGWACSGSLSVCHRGCGNGILKTQNGEQCDDQNNDDGDGCSRVCTMEKAWACSGEPSHCQCATTATECGLLSCGDGILNPGEACDNGLDNNASEGACNVNCSVKEGYVCRGAIGGMSRCTRDISMVLLEQEELKQRSLKVTGL